MLTREIIQRVRQIQIRTGRQVADVLAGEYVSVFKGVGVEFDEVRPYIIGDDVRAIDWNVTARMGQPYVKRYVEERRLTVMLMIDVSASQHFGSVARSKREAVAELGALIAFSAIYNDDNVGLTLFHGDVEQYIPPRKGQKHVLRVIREILAHDQLGRDDTIAQPHRRTWSLPFRRTKSPRSPRQATCINAAIQFLMKSAKRKTVCFLVSDFFDTGYEQAIRAANRKHDLIAVQVSDPRELQMPDVGMIRLVDAESGKTGLYDTGSHTFRTKFKNLAEQRNRQISQFFSASGIDFIRINTAESVVEPLVRFFHQRERRMRR